jgi:type III secretory pathway component EscR
MKKYSNICLLLGLALILSFFVFCISQAKSETLYSQSNNQVQTQIHVQQKQIKNKLDRIERKMKKREERRKLRNN